MENQGKVLIVDDDIVNTSIIEEILEEAYTLKVASDGETALQMVGEFEPDLILLDIMMPGMTGYEVCTYLKENDETKDIPVMFLTSRIETEDKVKGFKLGAADYITKPFEPDELLARVNTHMRLRKAQLTINEYNRHLEKTLEERTKNLIKTEREAAFSLMIQGIVHNLKNSLTSILGGADLIKMVIMKVADELPEEFEEIAHDIEDIDSFATVISESSRKLNEMVMSMMTKSSSDKSDKIECVDMNAILRQELEFLTADLQFSSKVEKEISLCDDYLVVEVVPSEVAQVFRNLIKNSVDAMWHQGDAKVTVTTGQTDKEVWFTVADNGMGIDEDIQQRIFDPFFSTKKTADEVEEDEPVGTGLGLHTCAEIMKSYNGRIELQSKVNEGAAFTVFLPLKG